jgi:hypothetical protein
VRIKTLAYAGLALAATLAGGAACAWELPKMGLPALFGGSKETALPPGVIADCPEVFMDNGASMTRVPPDADSANVRYQLSISATARECILDGDKLSIKVGVEGSAILGPVGAPGSYGANINIAVRRVKENDLVSSKNYRVAAAIPAGANRGDFHLIADAILVPQISPKAQNDYEIIVGFAQGGAGDGVEKPMRAGKRKKSKRG